MKESGQISIHAENILPIIKKWLYSEKDIFLRELVSNAADAITKLKKLALVGEAKEIPESKITIAVDEAARTLTISDTGLGLSAEEIKKYINQVAFSGLHDFMNKYKDKEDSQQVIGHFGLGFYSAFMVADRVEIQSLSFQEGATAATWRSKGDTDYELEAGNRKEIGTDIILHIGEDSNEVLNSEYIKGLLNKYCAFIRYPIEFLGEVVNEPTPIWTKSPTELTDDDYKAFFRKMFPTNGEPLFWIHLNVDYPFNMKGILYFPRLAHELDASQGEVKLFCNQVYVADNTKELIPEFLTLLKGVIDCPDIPLNVSRSYLQSDPTVRKIAGHITKKVADKITGMSKTDRSQFESYWDDINPFIKFGMMRDDKFCERLTEHVIFKTSAGGYKTIPEYQKAMQDKLEEGTVLYSSDENAQAGFLTMLKEQEMEAVICDTMIDRHFLPFLEMKYAMQSQSEEQSDSGESKGSAKVALKFSRVDSDLSSHLLGEKSKLVDPVDQKSGADRIEEIFKTELGKDHLKIKVESFKNDKQPALLLVDESMRRLQEMQQQMSGLAELQTALGGEQTLMINQNNKAVQNILSLARKGAAKENLGLMVHQIYDLAFIQQGKFSGDMMQAFVERSTEILGKLNTSGDTASSPIIQP